MSSKLSYFHNNAYLKRLYLKTIPDIADQYIDNDGSAFENIRGILETLREHRKSVPFQITEAL